MCQFEKNGFCGNYINFRDLIYQKEFDMNFNCLTCSKSFSRKDYLKRHQLNHVSKRQFECNACDVKFTRKDILIKHYKTKSHQKKQVLVTKETQIYNDDEKEAALLEFCYTDKDCTKSLFEWNIPESPKSTKTISYQTLQDILIIFKKYKVKYKYSIIDIENFLSNFWINFNTTYPIIHQPSFNPNLLNIWLLISIICIGMALSDKESYENSITIHKKLKYDLLKVVDKGNLQIIQAILLDNYYGMFLGNSENLNLFKIFFGSSINLLREAKIFKNLKEPQMVNDNLNELEKAELWESWIYYESFKRIGFFGFILDIQQSMIFKHEKLLSGIEIDLELPYTDLTWQANTSEIFFHEYFRQPKELVITSESTSPFDIETSWPKFLWSVRKLLQSYQTNQKEHLVDCFSQFSRLILLFGLVNITYDVKFKNTLNKQIFNQSDNSSMNRFLDGLNKWKFYFDKQIMFTNHANVSKNYDILNDYGASNVFLNSLTLLQFCTIIIDINTSLDPLDFNNIKRVPNYLPGEHLGTSKRDESSKKSLIASCQLISVVLNNPTIISQIPHVPYVLHISCMIIWEFEINLQASQYLFNKETIKQFFNDRNELQYDVTCEIANNYLVSVLDNEAQTILEHNGAFETQIIALFLTVSYLMKNSKLKASKELSIKLESFVNI